MDRLKNKILHHIDDLVQIESYMIEDATRVIFAAGISSRAAKEAVNILRKAGRRVGMLRPLTIWPFPDDAVRRYLSDKKMIIVPELNQGHLSRELKRVMGGVWNYSKQKSRKIVELQKNNGEIITPEEIVTLFREAK